MVAELGLDVPCANPIVQTMQEVVEVPRVQFHDRVADDPVGMQVPVTLERIVEATDVPVPRVMKELSSQLDGSCAAQAPEWDELQRLSDEELVTMRDTNKLLKDSDELVPRWLNVVRGVVDSEGLPLNFYRETLMRGKILRVIKKNHVKNYLEMLAEFAETEDYYNKIYEQFGMCLKHGIPKDTEASMGHTSPHACTLEIAELNDDGKKSNEQHGECWNYVDSAVGVKTAAVLRFNTSKPGDEQDNSEEYVDRMKEGQNDMCCITDDSIVVVSSLFEENLRKKGHEELYMADPVDEDAVHQVRESDGTKMKPTTKKEFDLVEELKTESEPLMKLMKDVLGDKVEMVIVSDRIVDSPCVLTTSEHGWSANTRRIMNAQALRDNSMTSDRVSEKTMEVNPTHPIMTELETRTSTDKSDKTVKDSISLLTSGFNLDGPTQFAGRVHRQQRDSSQAVASNNCKQQQPQVARQPTRQERGKEWGERKKERKGERERGRSEQEEKGREERESVRKGQRGRGQEGEAEEGGGEQVEKDVTGWTEVTRKKKRKTVQIFVKVNGSKATPMEVSLSDDKVEDVLRQVQNDEDVYVTMHGRMLKKSERLKSCGVTDGCTIQVTSRLRGGGRHRDKRSMAETKRNVDESGKKGQQVESMSDKCLEMTQAQKSALIQTIERNEGYRRLITTISEAENWKHEIQCFGKQLQEKSEIGEERAKVMKWGMRWAVEARKRRRDEEQGQSMGQEQDKEVHFGEEEASLEETQAESTDEPKKMSESAEVTEARAGRESTGFVRGGDERRWADESSRKGKGKGNEGKGEHGGKGGAGSKGTQQVENSVTDEDQENKRTMMSEENHEEDVRKLLEMVEREEMELEMMQQEEMEHEEQRGRVAPNMRAGGSHPQATSDPRKRKKETRVLRWADCNDEEGKENEEEVEEEKEAGQWETTEEEPPGLEEVESKQEAKKEEEAERKQKQEQEQERKAQEAHEEQRRAQMTLEKRKAQEERKKEVRVQEEREREVSAHEERREQEREAKAQGGHESDVKAQEGHEGEVKAQEEEGEDANSLHEESHVSDRHMTWWRNAWWVRVNNGPHLQTARDRRRVWRAATRAAQEVRDTGKVAGGEREKREQGKTERTESNTLHVVFHFPTATTATTAAAAATAATVRLQ